jgi:SAM-dependent methyltransferase
MNVVYEASPARNNFEYEDRYFYSYDRRKRSIEDIYAVWLKWVGLLDGKGKVALDVGAAFGYVVRLLERFGYTAFGVDISRYASLQSRSVIRADAEYPPFKDDSFDLITCFETIEHLEHSDNAIVNFRRLLKHHGTLLMTTPTPFGEKLHRRFLTHYPYYSDDDGPKATEVDLRAHHPSIRSYHQWEETLRCVGFANVAYREFILTPIILGKYRVLPIWSSLATHMAIGATK